jgi:hypothetical protein
MLGIRTARRHAGVVLTLAVLGTLALSAAPAPAAGPTEFFSGGGIACQMDTQDVFCIAIVDTTNAGLKATLNRRGHVSICHGIKCLGDAGEGTPTLKAGHSSRHGRFRCTSHKRSTTCIVVRTGKGFRMTRHRVVRVA